MSWKGTLRSIQAAQNRANRAALSRQRELEKQRKNLEKKVAIHNASIEVAEYENNLEVLLSLHKEIVESWNWESILNTPPPNEPTKSNHLELAAQEELKNYKPGLFDKLFNQSSSKIRIFENKLIEARKIEESEYQSAIENYEQDFTEWVSTTELAKRVINRDPKAYLDAILQVQPFDEITQLGTTISVEFNNDILEVTLKMKGTEIIPLEIKYLLKSGNLSTKNMPKSKTFEYYQDYVSSTILRTAKELFALLPIDKLIISATCPLLNTKTGYLELKPILSVFIPKTTFDMLNFDFIDPSDSMGNFLHNMNFQKTKGFNEVKFIKNIDLHQN